MRKKVNFDSLQEEQLFTFKRIWNLQMQIDEVWQNKCFIFTSYGSKIDHCMIQTMVLPVGSCLNLKLK